MKHRWLHQQGNQDCLLFFAGWGMCPEPVADIPSGAVDVLMFYDYRRMEIEGLSSALAEREGGSYRHVYLLSWSMGVWMASVFFGKNSANLPSLTATIAIGGTCSPIDDKLGIPEKSFAEMAEQLTPARVEAFHRSMFADEKDADRFARSFRRGKRSFAELQEELLVLAGAYSKGVEPSEIYTHKIVTGRDRIFPARNQVRAWGRTACRQLSLSHFPFYLWPSWSAMLTELTSA
jgi:pimeloyl-[acyl-carrier protein] methyl ester esterase